jgi:hypothetical protein
MANHFPNKHNSRLRQAAFSRHVYFLGSFVFQDQAVAESSSKTKGTVTGKWKYG